MYVWCVFGPVVFCLSNFHNYILVHIKIQLLQFILGNWICMELMSYTIRQLIVYNIYSTFLCCRPDVFMWCLNILKAIWSGMFSYQGRVKN
jgi:hypothetical protein